MPRPDRKPVWSSAEAILAGSRDEAAPRPRVDGPVRVRREPAGRRGKPVTTISDLGLDAAAVRAPAARLKRGCSADGCANNGVTEPHGDHRGLVVEPLRAEGYGIVLAGGWAPPPRVSLRGVSPSDGGQPNGAGGRRG
jgi:translation initiation factor 1